MRSLTASATCSHGLLSIPKLSSVVRASCPPAVCVLTAVARSRLPQACRVLRARLRQLHIAVHKTRSALPTSPRVRKIVRRDINESGHGACARLAPGPGAPRIGVHLPPCRSSTTQRPVRFTKGNFSCVRGQSGDFDRISFLVNSVWCGGTIGTRQAAKTLVLAPTFPSFSVTKIFPPSTLKNQKVCGTHLGCAARLGATRARLHPAPAPDAGPNPRGSCTPCAQAEVTSRARCPLRAHACRAIHSAGPVPARPRASQNVRAPPPLAHLSPPACMRQGPAGRLTSAGTGVQFETSSRFARLFLFFAHTELPRRPPRSLQTQPTS